MRADNLQHLSRSGRNCIGLRALFRRAVAPRGGQATNSIGLRGLDVEAAVAHHPRLRAIDPMLVEDAREQVAFAVARVVDSVAIDGAEILRDVRGEGLQSSLF